MLHSRMRRVHSALCLFLVACESSAAPPTPTAPPALKLPEMDSVIEVASLDPSPMGGERLRPIVLDLGDLDLPLGWWDTALETKCAFARSPQGDYRCIPETEYKAEEARSSSGYGPECRASTWAPEELVVHPTSDAYVVAHRVFEQAEGQRIGLEVLLTEDGARMPLRIHDHSHGSACTVEGRLSSQFDALATTTDRCIPSPFVLKGPYFSNDDCTALAYAAPASVDCPNLYQSLYDGQDAYAIARSHPSSVFESYTEFSEFSTWQECSELEAARSSMDVFTPGEKLPLAELQRGMMGSPFAIGVLQIGKDPVGAIQASENVIEAFDRIKSAPCQLRPMTNGDWECTGHRAIPHEPLFSDPECLHPFNAIQSPSLRDLPPDTRGVEVLLLEGESVSSLVRLGEEREVNAEVYTKFQNDPDCFNNAGPSYYVPYEVIQVDPSSVLHPITR